MNPLYTAYTILTSGLFLTGFPFFWIYTRLSGRYKRGLQERLGFLPRDLAQQLKGSPRIWIHAVSLGEVKVAGPIIGALKRFLPTCSIILSTTTEHGRNLAQETFKKRIPVVFAPIDTIISVRRALSRVRPNALVFLETEIWPAWIFEAHRMGIKTALVNGRISVRSIDGYLRFKPFFGEVLRHVDAFSMIREEDAERIMAMGAEPHKIHVNNNAKYDFLPNQVDYAMETEMRKALNLEPSQTVFVAGSTRQGEEELILDVYEEIVREFPDTVLLMAPRHIERAPEIASLVERRGFDYQLRSDLDGENSKRTKRVVIVNTFGELFKLYSVASIVFCGASLVPLGGQNPLEPAVWGKVVFYGPSMEDFLDAKALLEKIGAGITVSSPTMLAEKAIWFLKHPDELKAFGRQAREAVMRNQNAAKKHARVIAGLLDRA